MPDSRPASTVVWFDGAFVAAENARWSFDDRGVQFGVGFFETFRTSGGKPHHWRYHQTRLASACATAGIELAAGSLAFDPAKRHAVLQRLLAEHGMRDAVFRYTVSAGRVGERPVEAVAPRALPPPPPDEGVCVRVLQLPRDNGEWLPRPKSLGCANAWLGAEELRRRTKEASDEGLFLARESGLVVETTRQNIAWIVDGCLHYPDPMLGAVAGTCQAWVVELGAACEARRASLDELLAAEAIVVMNSVRGITPVHLVFDADDRPLRRGIDSRDHPLVASLRRQWTEALEATADD